MSNYAILRTAKLKKPGNFAASASHIERTRATDNADPGRTPGNQWLIGGPGMYAAAKGVWDALPRKRSDAVHGFEVVLTATPDAFHGMNLDEWKKENIKFLQKQFKGCAIVGACLHLDESTPHIHALIVPTDKNPDGSLKLNCKKYLGGAAKLSKLQTDYAKAMSKFELERGIQGSEAKHTKISQFYSAINSKSAVKFSGIKVEQPPLILSQSARAEWARQQTKAFADQLAKPIADLKENARSAIIHKRQAEQLRNANGQLSAENAELKRQLREQADRLRQLPLTEVAERLGCIKPRNAKDKNLYMTPAGKVFITNKNEHHQHGGFINHETGDKGGGAIDLVMHIRDCDFKTALATLRDMYGDDAAIEAAATRARLLAEEELKKKPRAFAFPEPVHRSWERVRDYLTKTRGLAGELIDKLKERGWIYADRRNNAVFVYADAHTKKIAYELKGTTETPFKQAQGESGKGIFIVGGGTDKLAVCESAIDAISYVQLHPQCSAIAVAGTGKYEAAKPFIEQHGERFGAVVCASDNDGAGAMMAVNLGLLHEPPPRPGADWNEFLLDPSTAPQAAQEAAAGAPSGIADRSALPAERRSDPTRQGWDEEHPSSFPSSRL